MCRGTMVAIALAAGLSGCAAPFVCARKGGTPWIELRTEHFLLYTDHSAEQGRELAFELERMRDAIAHTLVQAPTKGPAVVHVLVMRSSDAWELFSPAREAAGIFTHSVWGDPTIVFSGYLDATKRRIIAHELTHLLYSAAASRQPPWFQEGIATYAETPEISASDGRVTLGKVSEDRAIAVYRSLRGGMRPLLESRGLLTPSQYGLAWILVHFLVTERSDELGDLEERFARGDDPVHAWRAVFPQWDPAKEDGPSRLEDAVWSYALRAKTLRYRHPPLASIPPPRERPLSPAEVHDVRLALPWSNLGRPLDLEDRMPEAAEALDEEPGSPTATLVASSAPSADRRALAERATRARPDDARNWVLLAAALPEDDLDAKEAALRKAISVDADNPTALNALARHLLARRRAAEALPHARRAVELAPWSPIVLDTASGVLEQLGNCRGALGLSERAVASLGDDPPKELRDPVSKRRERLFTACGRER